MINAAIVGLGSWGKTMVESLASGSDAMRFVALPDAHGVAGRRGLCQAAFAAARSTVTRRCSPIRRSTRWCWRRRPRATCKQIVAAANAGKHVFCEKPFTFSKKEAEDGDRRHPQGQAHGRRRLQPALPSRDDQAARAHPRRRSRHHPAHRSNMTYPNALFLPPTAWRAMKDEAPCGGLAPMGVHAIDAMIDLCGEIDHVYCQSFRARGADRRPTTPPRCCSA